MSIDLVTESPAMPPAVEQSPASVNKLSWQWTAFGAIALSACGHLLIKSGLNGAAHSASSSQPLQMILHYLLMPAVPIGLGIYGLGTLLWIRAVSRRNISFLYPLTAMNYVIVSVGAKIFFNETLSTGRCVGIAIVVLGVAMLQLSARGSQS